MQNKAVILGYRERSPKGSEGGIDGGGVFGTEIEDAVEALMGGIGGGGAGRVIGSGRVIEVPLGNDPGGSGASELRVETGVRKGGAERGLREERGRSRS